MNKMDICPQSRVNEMERAAKFDDNIVPLSAQTGQGVEDLLSRIDIFLSSQHIHVTYPPSRA